MTTPPDIRPATPDDARAIAHLSTELGYPVAGDECRERLENLAREDCDHVLVAEAGGVILGWAQAHAGWILESGFRAEITGLVVEEGARRSGVGRSLVEKLEAWARNHGATSLTVRTNVMRVESPPFYQALGFVPTKQQQVYRKVLGT